MKRANSWSVVCGHDTIERERERVVKEIERVRVCESEGVRKRERANSWSVVCGHDTIEREREKVSERD